MTKHTHQPVGDSRIVGWSHCIAAPSQGCSGVSHGGVTIVETCRCGAMRKTESNGGRTMTGRWIAE